MYNYVHTSYKKIIRTIYLGTVQERKQREDMERLTTEYGFGLCLQTVFHDDNGD